MSVEACAALVQRGDPDRFLATMAAPPALRARLFPLYAFNLEVARAPLVTAEPLIAEMRLQWWRDALAEVVEGRPVRRHEVTTPLADAIDPEGARLLDDLVAARRTDIASAPFVSADALVEYLDRTAGTLLWVAARAAGVRDGEEALRAIGTAQGLANWFLAVPALAARGREPLPDPTAAGVAALARAVLARFSCARPPRQSRSVRLAAWRAPALLAQAARHPARVLDGRYGQSEFRRRGSLLLAGLFG